MTTLWSGQRSNAKRSVKERESCEQKNKDKGCSATVQMEKWKNKNIEFEMKGNEYTYQEFNVTPKFEIK